jgi:hypothetical protein
MNSSVERDSGYGQDTSSRGACSQNRQIAILVIVGRDKEAVNL